MENNKLTLSGEVLFMTLFTTAFLYGTRSEMASASEYDTREEAIANSEGISAKEFSQQNECQGNIVICQNILAKFVCTERAVCILGNLDPFLLVLPN